MADLTWAVDLAEELIDEYGRNGVLAVFEKTKGSNPWEESSSTEVLYDCRVIFTRYSKEYIDGTLIHKDDRVALVAAKGMGSFSPNLNGEIRVSERTWKIVSCEEVQPAEQVILYRFQVRL